MAYIANQELWKNVASSMHTLIQTRNFSWVRYVIAILSLQVVDLCSSIERVFQMNMEGLMAESHVMARLKQIIRSSIQTDSYKIDACCTEHQVYWINTAITIFLRVRINHFVRIRNREIKELAEKKKEKRALVNKLGQNSSKPSRKTKKVKHL